MDTRRLNELRDVYTQLWHQSTGADGAQAAVDMAPPVGIASVGVPAADGAVGGPLEITQDLHHAGHLGLSPRPLHASGPPATAAPKSAPNITGLTVLSNSNYDAVDKAFGDAAAAAAFLSMPTTAGVQDEVSAALAPAPSSSPAPPTATAGAIGIHHSSNISTSLALSSGKKYTAEELYHERKLMLEEAMAAAAAVGGCASRGSRSRSGSGGGTSQSGVAAKTPLLKRDSSSLSASEEHDAAGGASAGGISGRKRKRKSSERNSFYPGSYFDWTDELMAKQLPERSNRSFVAAIFELGLKHSSPKVLMKLMNPKAGRLTTEHIKSRLQKYRLHAHRSKDEFLEFFSLRLQAKFSDFLLNEGWRNLSADHGRKGYHEESGYDSAGGDDGAEGEVGAGGGESVEVPNVKVNGQAMGDILDLGAQCVRDQLQLQEMLRTHISAQVKLQTEIHQHLTGASMGNARTATARAPPAPSAPR